ncbi:MAG: ribosomal protein S18 acetylase RimI-like enzyme [Paracoccaceae bacterium]
MTVRLRPARSTDAGKLGVILKQFQDDNDWMPDLYTAGETIAFCGALIDRGWVTVAMQDDQVVGFLARDGAEICALYLSRQSSSKGIGRALLDDAKTRSTRLTLRVFQANSGAQRFYQREGFAEVGQGDGADNDENLPDIAYVWPKEAAK